MKMNILLFLFGIFLFGGVYANGENGTELEQAEVRLLQINKGAYYKTIVDKWIGKYSLDEKKLIIIKNNIEKSISRYNKLQSKKAKNMQILLEYLLMKVESHLEKIVIDKNKTDIIPDKKDDDKSDIDDGSKNENNTSSDTNKDYNKSSLYPGFSNNYREYFKTILAGQETTIYNGSMVANLEEIEVKSIEFSIQSSDLTSFNTSLKEAILYVEGKEVGRTRRDGLTIISQTNGKLVFDNLDNLIVPKEQIEYRLALIPQPIGYQSIGKVGPEVSIVNTKIIEAVGLTSGSELGNIPLNDSSEKFIISPSILDISVDRTLNNSVFASFNIKSNSGLNRKETSPSLLKTKLESINFIYSSTDSNTIFKIYEKGNSSDYIIGVKQGGTVKFNIGNASDVFTLSDGEMKTYEIQIQTEGNSTVSLDLDKKGIIYSVEGINTVQKFNINLDTSLNFGVRKY